jgi:putative endopeptidase
MLERTGTLLLAFSLASIAFTGSAQSPGLKGVQLSDMETSAAPCDDFYDYANGGWRAKNPIPASMDRWSRRWQAGEVNKDQLRIILDDISSRPQVPGSPNQLSADFYAACTDTKAIDAAGITPLAPYLAQIDAVHDLASLNQELSTLHADGVMVPFPVFGNQDAHDPTRVIAEIAAGGLGLPDRDYYLKPEQRFVTARANYLVHVANIFKLAGESAEQAASDAKTVMAFETSLAKASLDNVALRDPHAVDHPTTFDQLQKMTPHLDWTAFYAQNHIPQGPLNVDQPAFLAEVDRQLASTPLPEWKTYLRWQLLDASADHLSQPFVDEHFNFYSRQLGGVTELKPRPTRCAEQTDAYLGEALGQEYVKRYFPPEAKARATALVNNLLSGMHDSIAAAEWMTPATRQRAFEKLAAFHVKIGYPDKWKDYSSVKITRTGYFEDTMNANRFLVIDDHSAIGKPVDRNRWGMTPPTSNAYYNPQMNEIVFPAGILQPPAFSLSYSDAVNYGAIGVVIGHEISHGFDDQGAQFDATGKLDNWWTPADLAEFHKRTACVAHQFDGYTIDGPGNIHINGKLTLGESIGDLGGVNIAYRAFKKTAQGQSSVKQDGFTPDQQFFIAWGQFRGDEVRLETQRLDVQGDPHPLAKYRVIGPLSNFAPFAAAFSCKEGSTMSRPVADRCIVW